VLGNTGYLHESFGWSTDQPHLAAIFAESDNCVAIQHRVNVFSPADEVLALCEKTDLASINKSPLNSALLTGKFHENYEFEETDGRTMAQGALAWFWAPSDRTIPIPGFKKMRNK